MTPKSAVTVSNMATILRPRANDLTAEVATQSKEFQEKLNFEILMMILCNRLRHAGTAKTGPRLAHLQARSPVQAGRCSRRQIFAQPLLRRHRQRHRALPAGAARSSRAIDVAIVHCARPVRQTASVSNRSFPKVGGPVRVRTL